MNINQLQEKFKKINIFESFENFVNDNPKLFIDALKEQMIQGKNGNGENIGEYRSIPYSILKYEQNPRASGNVDLFRTGAFYNGFTFKTELTDKSMNIQFYSTDEKNDKLSEKYEVVIWEFNEETIRNLKPEILFKFKDYVF